MAGVGLDPGQNLELAYLLVGEGLKSEIDEILGPDWEWRGGRALDFGCGSGRLLRHFLDEAREGELYGSDIDPEMVAWVQEHLCPPIAGAKVNGALPPLDFPDGHFDLVTALSVFTHIVEGWSEWLLEIRRVLKPSGLLIATFLDPSCARYLGPAEAEEEAFGMSTFGDADPAYQWPNVLHSQWWLREHWGRAFEIVELRPGSEDPGHEGLVSRQGWVVLRPREGSLSAADLEREDPSDPRYPVARRYQEDLLQAEAKELRSSKRLGRRTLRQIAATLRRARSSGRLDR